MVIPESYYRPIFLYLTIFLTLICALRINGQSYLRIKEGSNNTLFALLLSVALAVWLGQRPVNFYSFGDTGMYAHQFDICKEGLVPPTLNVGEWVWYKIIWACAQVINVHTFFTIIDLGYFGFTFLACRRLTPNNPLVSLLFIFGAFSFYSYGVNGIRNGLAASMILASLSYLAGNKRDKIIAFVIAFFAINIHRTMLLPIGMAVISLYLIRSFKTVYTFWILSILISLVAGNFITTIFAGLGFDDRLGYLTDQSNSNRFSAVGFRWDFLIYSMMPILLGYYVVIKRGIQNKTYLLLLNTYTLANAFWVMVIRASFSNRFAYLSWFMYPIVLAYPLLCLDIWGPYQGRRLKQIMLAQLAFTWFMETFYWS